MASSYDVFIKGIRSDKLHEAEQIKKKLSQTFKVSIDEIETAWQTPSGFCIRRGVTSEVADHIQITLAKSGVICLYRPAVSGIHLSLEELVEEDTDACELNCPYCEVKIKWAENEPKPVQCPHCAGVIAKYDAEAQERKKIKDRLLKLKAEEDARIRKQKEDEEEHKRKQKLEEEISIELFGRKRQINKKLLILGGVAIVMTSGASFYLANNRVEDEGNGFMSAAVSGGVATGTLNTAESGESMDAQAALQTTHDQANKVLNAFGMDADKLVTGQAPGSQPNKEAAVAIPPSNFTVAKAQQGSTDVNSSPLTAALLQAGRNDQEWDLFLTLHIAQLLLTNQLDRAYEVTQYLIDTENYINTMGQLLAQAQLAGQDSQVQKIMRGIESRVGKLTTASQAGFLAQAGFYQQYANMESSLLSRAETLWQQLSDSTERIKAALHIAVYYFKSGNTDKANNYFSQATGLLNQLDSPDEQLIARAATGRAYYDVNDNTNALSWLSSAENLVYNVSLDALQEFIGSYAYINQSPLDLVQDMEEEKQSILLYRAVQIALQRNLTDNAWNIGNAIQSPMYKALASDLMASYQPDIAPSFLNVAETELQSIRQPIGKIVVNSRLARHYARLGNVQKVNTLMSQVKQTLTDLPASQEKDHILHTVSKNLLQALQFNIAEQFARSIQAKNQQTALQQEINVIKKASALLK